MSDFLKKIERDGYIIIPSVISSDTVKILWSELDQAMQVDIEKNSNIFDAGMVHNCFTRGEALCQILNNPILDQYISHLLGEHFIMYAYQASSLPPFSDNYGSRIHVDSPRYIENYQTNIGVIFPLTDFTINNGATWVLPKSHNTKVQPTDEQFNKQAIQATCNAGDMIIFLGRLWHKAGQNNTSTIRHSITLNFCRSYMRQRFDYPRLINQNTLESLNSQGKRLIGMNVRMPTSLDEFYLPAEKRLYKPNQG